MGSKIPIYISSCNTMSVKLHSVCVNLHAMCEITQCAQNYTYSIGKKSSQLKNFALMPWTAWATIISCGWWDQKHFERGGYHCFHICNSKKLYFVSSKMFAKFVDKIHIYIFKIGSLTAIQGIQSCIMCNTKLLLPFFSSVQFFAIPC